MIIRTFSFYRIGSDYYFLSDIFFLLKCKRSSSTLLRFFMFYSVVLLSIQRILSDLLRCPKTLICPDTKLLPMSPMRLPLCPKSFWAAYFFQPRKLNFVLLSFDGRR